MTDDGLDRLRKDCPQWNDDYLAEQFSTGQAAFASSEAWDIVRSEAVNRGLVSEAVARAMESETPAGDHRHRQPEGWGRQDDDGRQPGRLPGGG